MPQVRVLSKGARITGGVFCLLFAVHTWIWVVRDVAALDMGNTWKVWTGAIGPGGGVLTEIPATTGADLGLGLLQVAAAFAAFTGAWAAGGLMTATTALTFAWRLPVIWHAALHSESSPYYAMRGISGDGALDAAAASCVGVVLLCVPLAIVLSAGNQRWPRPAAPGGGQPGGWQPQPPPVPPVPEPPLPSEAPQRPTGAHALVAALLFGVLVLFNIGWSIHAVYSSGGGFWLRLFTGQGTVTSLLGVAPAWAWLFLTILYGIGAALCMARTVSARGFSLGLAIAAVPEALTILWGIADSGTFFQLGPAPAYAFFGRMQLLVALGGAAALITLAVRPGVPVRPDAQWGAGAPTPFAPGPQPMQQPYFPPQPGPAGAAPYAAAPPPPAGPPPNAAPGYGFPPPPAQPPAAPPPPQGPPQGGQGGQGGGFGPPPVY